MASTSFPPALPHGELRELFDDVFYVSGSIAMPGPPIRFSRGMTVVRQDGSLTLIGSMRLTEDGLAKLEALGTVEHVIRIAAFHGRDDPFYQDRYGARVLALRGSAYAKGFDTDTKPEDGYFRPDAWIDADSELPIEGARLHVLRTATVPEGLLHLDRDGGILVSGDALQNWARTDEFFNLPGKVVMKLMGFIKPCNVGPGWLKGAKPDRSDIRGILDLDFDHVLPVHGAPVLGNAKERFRPAIERVS